jgi:membrane-bound lytic murein transglycosylase MltF
LTSPTLLGWLLLASIPATASAQRAFGAGTAEVDRYDDSFRKYSKRFFGPAFEWRTFKAQALAESNLNPRARSRVGARGLMQLMPSTFRQIQSNNRELRSIDDPEWNIAAGIEYDRYLWQLWDDHETDDDRLNFVFGSYNAGRATILRAQTRARQDSLDHRRWLSIETVAPRVRNWRHGETLSYVRKIDANLDELTGRTPEALARQMEAARALLDLGRYSHVARGE